MRTPRHITVLALCRVEQQEAWSNLALESYFQDSGLDSRDKAFASALFYGVLSRIITLDACLAAHSKTPVNKLDTAVRAILREAVFQLLYMDSVPEHAAVSEAVTLTKRLRRASASGFVNAVLRSFLRSGKKIPLPVSPKEQHLSVKYSCSPELAKMLLDTYGSDTTDLILTDALEAPPVFLRVNTLKATDDELINLLAAHDIAAEPDTVIPHCLRVQNAGALHTLPEFKQGLFHVQDRSSQLCAKALDVKPGQSIIDVCAAPGGKSFVLAQQMQNSGHLLCCDLYEHRTGLIAGRAKELGVDIIETKTADMTVYLPELGEFDRVLCDVPCSGYGAMRRRPEIKYKSPAEFADLPDLQYKLLETSSHYCKAGGLLLHSTCTLNPTENNAVTQRFLADNPAFSIIEQSTVLPDKHGGDGFYICVMKRSGT